MQIDPSYERKQVTYPDVEQKPIGRKTFKNRNVNGHSEVHWKAAAEMGSRERRVGGKGKSNLI